MLKLCVAEYREKVVALMREIRVVGQELLKFSNSQLFQNWLQSGEVLGRAIAVAENVLRND